jgi:hypothetical protein
VHDRGGLGATRDVLTDVVHSVPSPI